MTNGKWDGMMTEEESSGGGKKIGYIKFPEGVTILRVFSPEKHARWTHYVQNIKMGDKTIARGIDCIGEGCPICALRASAKEAGTKDVHNSSFKTSMLVLNKSTGEVEMLEQGKTFMKDFINTMRKGIEGDEFDDLPGGWNPDEYDIAVRREGLGMSDTRYSFKIQAPNELTEQEQAKIADVPDNFLQDYFTKMSAEQILKVLNGEDLLEVLGVSKD